MSSQPEPHKTPCGNPGSSKHKKKKRSRINTEDLTHPYILKFDTWEAKIMKSLNKLYDLADNDLFICDRCTGLNDFNINLKFADKLEDLSKALVTMSSKCCQKATDIWNKISEAQDHKHVANHEIFFLGEVSDTDKCDIVQGQKTLRSNCFKSDPDKLPPPPPPKRQHVGTIYISTDEEDEVQPGNIDAKFTYVKSNNNTKECYNCSECGKCFRDGQELRNHASNHALELYRCIRCSHISRSERSFYNHIQTHRSALHHCPHEDCGQYFTLKTSLTNHLQKHSPDKMHCSVCQKEFTYRQSYIEHEQYWHRKTQTVPCPVCNKLFWTPTSMRSHHSKYHTLVSEMYREF